jgi:photosystem II stability/assembly factor-like uncharacterized protein
MNNSNDIYRVDKYTEKELFDILDIVNPSDRELEAKILHMIWKYENFGNESGDKLAQFFKDIYDHFFDTNEEHEETTIEGFDDMENTNKEPEKNEQQATDTQNNTNSDSRNVGYSFPIDYSKDTLNPLLKQTIKRIVSIDSQYRDNKNSLSTDFTFNLSDPLRDVVNLKLYSIQIPHTWWTINNNFGSNFFYLKGNSPGINDGNHDYKFEIPVGNYTAPDLITAVNTSINKFKTDPMYNDVSFGTTGIIYDYPSSKSTLIVDLTKHYTEPYYSTSFENWTTPNDPSGNRGSSIPAFLGFNRPTYYQYRVYSILDTLPYTDSSAAIIDTQASLYNLTNTNNYFNIVQYIGDACPADLSSNTVKKIIKIQLSNLTTGTTYSRNQLLNELNTQLDLNPNLTSLSGINRVDTKTQYVKGYGFSHYELDIRLNRLTTDNSENIKTAVVFPSEASNNNIWVGQSSAFVFQRLSNELSDIIAETSTTRSRFDVSANPYIYLQCKRQGYVFDLDKTKVNDISFNDYKIVLSDSSANGYTLPQYMDAINTSFANVNNKTKVSIYNPNGDFKLNPLPASINSNNYFDLKIDLTKTFTQQSYLMDLSYNRQRTALSRILNIPSNNPIDASLINIDLSQNSVFTSSFTLDNTNGYAIDTSYLMIIKPKPTSSNRNAPTQYIPPIANKTYYSITELQNDLNTAFNNFKDTDGNNNILQGTNVSFIQNGSTVNSTLTVVIRKILTQEDYQLVFVDPKSSTTTSNFSTYGNTWKKSNATALDWKGISVSSTGQYQTAIINQGNAIYTSSNYGIDWSSRTTSNSQYWRSISVSSTGQYQSAGTLYSGTYYSKDNGATWTKSNMPNVFFVPSIAMSSNGQYQTLVVNGAGKWESTDYGVYWTEINQTILPYRNYSAVGISDSGQYQTICVNGGFIYYTQNSGATWNQSNASSSGWGSIAVSSTGQYQVACGAPANVIYSSDYGKTWTASNLLSGDYYSISMSKTTGQYQTLVKNTGIYYSTNYGVSWTASDASGSSIIPWGGVSVSSDGTYQSATAANNGIYYSQLTTSSGGSNTNTWSITDPSNSWGYNLKIGDSSYNLSNPLYNSYTTTFTEILGTSALVVSGSIFITSSINNIFFKPLPIDNGGDGVYSSGDLTITLPNGFYTVDNLITEINNQFSLNPLTVGSTIGYISSGGLDYIKMRMNINKTYTAGYDYRLVFYDPYSFINFVSTSSNLKTLRNTSWDSTLGWILGFRNSTEYDLSTITPTNGTIQITGDTVVSINIYSYFMIMLDDYNQNHLNDGLVTTTQKETDLPLPSYTNRATFRCDPSTGKLITSTVDTKTGNNLTQKQIYAAQEVVNSITSYTTTANSNQKNYYSSGPFAKNVFALLPMKIAGLDNNDVYVDYGGTLQNQERTYFGPVNIHRMTVKLVNDKGEVVDLNGANWSFSFICEQLYQQKKT